MSKSAFLVLVLVFITASVIEINPVSKASTIENTWTTKTPLPQEMGSARAAVVNGKIYLMGSFYKNYSYIYVFYEYDPETNIWVAKTLKPTPEAISVVVSYQNKIYAMGESMGYTKENGTIYGCTNEVYDPATDTWEAKTPIPANQSRYLLACVVYGQIYVMGANGHYVYDVATDSWTSKEPQTFQYPCGAVVFDSKIYVFDRNLTRIYDPKSDTWSLGTPSPTYTSSAGVCATTGVMAQKRIYLFGGTIGIFESNDATQVYDPATDTWTLGEPMPTSRGASAVAVVNDQIYVIGGTRNMYYRSNANELYTPFGYGTPDPSYVPLDSAVPEVSVLSPENKTYYTPDIQLNLTVNEPDLWMRYNLDNENITEISGNTTITGLSLGAHNLTVYATDEAGNTAACKTIHFEVQEPFPTTLVLASVTTAAVVSIGLLVYFRKRGKKAGVKQ
jgi:N-acetylneuraminic acid mutarotase